MRDLYPNDSWNYIEGMSDDQGHIGVVSLGRHAEYLGLQFGNTDKQAKLLKRSFPTITREINHLFGLQNCIYFECTMNMTNCNDENERNENEFLCPVCLCKLKMNLFFDCRERFASLINVCAELGLDHEEHGYNCILTDWLQSPAFSNVFFEKN